MSGVASPEAWLFDLLGATPTLAGVVVNPWSAMTCAPVACAVRSISEPAGSLPLHIYKKLPDGGKEKATDHSAYKLLHDAPNSFTPAALFRTQVMADALLQPHGGFALINRVDGKPYELIRLDPISQSIAVDYSELEPTYKLNGRDIDGADLIHIPTPAYDPRNGLVGEGREAIGLALTLERHAARLFGKGGRPSGMLSTKGAQTIDSLTKIGAAWKAAHGGDNSGGTAILPSDVSWQSITLSSVDAQFLEMRNYAVREIGRLFRVPPHMLMDPDRSTPRSLESIGQEFVELALLPRLKAFEQELELKLLTPEERDQYCIEFNVDGFARADLLTRAQAMSTAVSSRVLNPNEARQMGFGLPAYEGGDVFENFNTSSAHAGGKLNGNDNNKQEEAA